MRTLVIRRRVREGGYSACALRSFRRATRARMRWMSSAMMKSVSFGSASGRSFEARGRPRPRSAARASRRASRRRAAPPPRRGSPRPAGAGQRHSSALRISCPIAIQNARRCSSSVLSCSPSFAMPRVITDHGTSRQVRQALLHRLQRLDVVRRGEAARAVEGEEAVEADGARRRRSPPSARAPRRAPACGRARAGGRCGWSPRSRRSAPGSGRCTRLRLVSATRAARASPRRATSSARMRSISGFAASP